jgi:archaellum component FlaC
MPRQTGDIENDLGFVQGLIDDLEIQLADLRYELEGFQQELEDAE